MLKEAFGYEKVLPDKVSCYLCAHRCLIKEGKRGICGVRENRAGALYSLVYGKAIACHIDPIEKKPLFHFLPGSTSLSVATAGCNFRCSFCQNWQISQTSKGSPEIPGEEISPKELVRAAKKNGCQSISYTYTEPTIFFEYAYDTSKLAKAEGLFNNFVTNGFMTKEALETISPYLDAANVDLKSARNDFYKKLCGASLEPVLDSIRLMKELSIWVEVTTLIVPGQNDSEEELKEIAGFIASCGQDIPWHISRFHPDYKMTNSHSTPISTIKKAREIGLAAGLRYVYPGNIPGEEGESTFCYRCGQKLIARYGFAILENRLKEGGCSECGIKIDGVGL